MLKLSIKNTTMKFYEILTKTERDINKNLNFALGPLFPGQNIKLKNRERYMAIP